MVKCLRVVSNPFDGLAAEIALDRPHRDCEFGSPGPFLGGLMHDDGMRQTGDFGSSSVSGFSQAGSIRILP
jgi:hypothetical protein